MKGFLWKLRRWLCYATPEHLQQHDSIFILFFNEILSFIRNGEYFEGDGWKSKKIIRMWAEFTATYLVPLSFHTVRRSQVFIRNSILSSMQWQKPLNLWLAEPAIIISLLQIFRKERL